jgi:hypothetical protein
MRIKHIMKDGTKRESVEGVVITNKEFYQVLRKHQPKEGRGK